MNKPTPKIYRTTNWSFYNKALINRRNISIWFTTNNVSDAQVLEYLLDQIPQDEQIGFVYTDGAYDTKQCRQVIIDEVWLKPKCIALNY